MSLNSPTWILVEHMLRMLNPSYFTVSLLIFYRTKLFTSLHSKTYTGKQAACLLLELKFVCCQSKFLYSWLKLVQKVGYLVAS